MPRAAQIAPINGIVVEDFTGDGHQDILLGGNMYGTEAETTRADASVGLLLKGNGTRDFQPLTASESGFFIPYDVKNVQLIKIGKWPSAPSNFLFQRQFI